MNAGANHAKRHVYHLGLLRLLIVPLLWISVVGVLLGLYFGDLPAAPAENQAFLTAAAIITLIMLPFFGIVWQSRLVVTPDSIAHHQFGYTVRSSWANLERLSLDPGAEAIVLTEPGTGSVLLRLSSRFLGGSLPVISASTIGDPDLLARGRLIYLAPFMAHWRRGQLRDDLLRWAPHLFDAAGQPKRS